MKTVLITGVSDGIGESLARQYLQQGHRVLGVSRRTPAFTHEHFIWQQADLTDVEQVISSITALGERTAWAHLDVVFLNAGKFGTSPKRSEYISVSDFMDVMALNVGAVKATMDTLLNLSWRPSCVVASASISGKRPRPGMVSYATSKAALNALIKLYHLENPDIQFLPLGLCNVGTHLYEHATTDIGPDLPELLALKERAQQPGYVVTPDERAAHMIHVLESPVLADLEWGEFYEIRDLLKLI